MSKVKVPGGAFYAGEGLNVDPITRTVSAGGGGTQPDWNQSDESASDYIKNRPGGYASYTVSSTATETKTFKPTSDSGKFKSDNTTGYTGEFGNPTVESNKVDVIFNGVEYKDVDFANNTGTATNVTYIGDKNLAKYPFCLDVGVDNAGSGMYEFACYSTIEGQVEVTVKIYKKSITKIPKQYVEAPTALTIDVSDGNQHSVVSSSGYTGKTFISIQENGGVQKTNIKGAVLNSGLKAGEATPIEVNGAYMKLYEYNASSRVKMILKDNSIILKSSTASSNKYFKITVDDSGNLTATETTI